MSARPVLVIDDEEAIRRSMQLMLRVLGYEVQAFESGIAFLAAEAQLPRGCVLLDLRMPEIDGLEVQRRLRANGADFSIVVMSGHGDLAVAVTAMEQGAVAYLEKPFSRVALEQALELAFRRVENPGSYREYLLSAAAALRNLEPIDRTVFELIARGHDPEHIARQTGLTPPVIHESRARIYAELGVDTATAALRLAFAARRAAPH